MTTNGGLAVPNFEWNLNNQHPDLEWEGLDVTTRTYEGQDITSGGYINTLFHVWSPDTVDATKAPILLQHGSGGNYIAFMGSRMFREMVDAGHNVYLGNNRGAEYSQRHETLDIIADKEQYFAYSQDQFADDVFANIKAMYENSGNLKGYYFGHSLGGAQMTIAMMQNQAKIAQYLNKSIILAPCTVLGATEVADLSPENTATVGALWNLGVYSTPTDDWATDYESICNNLGEPYCSQYSKISQQDAGRKTQRQEDHRLQNTMTRRFQKFIPLDDWPTVTESELYDLTAIDSMPVSMFVGENDMVCSVDRAQEYADAIGNLQNHYVFKGWGHGEPSAYDSDGYMELIMAEVNGTLLSEPHYEYIDPAVMDGGSSTDNTEPAPVINPQAADFPDFAWAMDNKYPGYSWEALAVTTEDNYELNMFHIWKEGEMIEERGPIMFQHGHGGAAMDWLYAPVDEGTKPNFQKFIDLGHHVYLGNNRGSKYSQGHASLDMVDDAEQYWNFTQHELALDVYAQVEAMYTQRGNRKGFYFGHSLGGAQMTIALIRDESRLTDKLNRVMILAPCTILGIEDRTDPQVTQDVVYRDGAVMDLGIYSRPTATWEDDVDTICQDSQLAYECATYGWVSPQTPNWTPIKQEDHRWQNTYAARFQQFDDDFTYPYVEKPDLLYDITNIQEMPISFYVGQEDGTCTPWRALWYAEQLQTVQNYYEFEGWNHGEPMFINWPGYFDLWVKDVASPPQAAPTSWEIQELNPESFIPEGAESFVSGSAITVALLATLMKLIF